MPIAVPRFTAPYTADADLAPYLITKFGSIDGNVAVAASATDNLLGVSENVPVAAGQTATICHTGSIYVTYGASVTAGQYVTSDAQGRAVPAAPAAGANVSVLGRALETGIVGDIRPVLLNIGQIQG